MAKVAVFPTELAPIGKNGKNTGTGCWTGLTMGTAFLASVPPVAPPVHGAARCHPHGLDPQAKNRGRGSTGRRRHKRGPARTTPPLHHDRAQDVAHTALSSSPGLPSMTARPARNADAWRHLQRLGSRCHRRWVRLDLEDRRRHLQPLHGRCRRRWVRQPRLRLLATNQNPSPTAGHATPCRSRGKTSTAIAHYSRNWHSMPSKRATAWAAGERAGAPSQVQRAAS